MSALSSIRLGSYALGLALLAACTTAPSAPAPAQVDAAAAPVGKARGYLQAHELPDSLLLSPPPPAPGSAAAALDEAVAAQALALRGSARFEQARVDAELRFPVGAEQFSCALGVTVDAGHTPTLYQLLERSRIDASAATKDAKNRYQRPRPFMANGQPTCTPADEEALRNSGSYPSGHTAIGWAWGLILAEIDPEHADALVERGRNYGHSRLVCNVHWYSDVQQGQFMGAAAVARLHGNPEFMADLAKARIELAYARTLGLAPPRDCEAEAKVLATGLSEAR